MQDLLIQVEQRLQDLGADEIRERIQNVIKRLNALPRIDAKNLVRPVFKGFVELSYERSIERRGFPHWEVPVVRACSLSNEFFRGVPNSKLIIMMARSVINPPTSWMAKTRSLRIR